jgi:hypothetical protein
MLKEILRNTLAALAGAFTGIVLITLAQLLSARIYPLPAGIDRGDSQAMGEFIRSLPLPAMFLVLAGYLVGVLGGAWVGGRLSCTAPGRQVFLITALFLIASVMNLTSFPHPPWFWVANLGAVLYGGWLAMKLQPKPVPPS